MTTTQCIILGAFILVLSIFLGAFDIIESGFFLGAMMGAGISIMGLSKVISKGK